MDGLPMAAEASDKIVPDAMDSNGRPAVRSRTGGLTSAAMILVVELCERLTTLGIGVNLVTYLTDTMHLGSAAAANVVTNFFGTSFMLALLGGFVADTYIGRYFTIAISTAIQASGVTVLTASAAAPWLRPPACEAGICERATGTQMVVLYLALYLTAVGTGGLKSSVSGFGSDQLDESDRVEKMRMEQFFGWFFFFISLGSLVAVTVLVYMQENLGRNWGYGTCAIGILAGLCIFLAGTSRYRFKRLAGSPLTQIAAVAVSAFRKRGLALPADPSLLYDVGGENGTQPTKQRLPHTDQFRFLERAAIVESRTAAAGEREAEKQSRWRLSTATDVEEVKMVMRMLPIWATTIMFWTVYSQMTTFSVSQAAAMDRGVGPSFEIPAGSLTVFFVASILLTVPIYDRLVAPVCRRLTADPHGLSPLRRIGVGLALSILSMAAAALTERRRLGAARDRPAEPLPVFLLVPQFFFVGAGEAFVYGGQLDFFLRESPRGMKTMSTGLFLSTLALGFFLSSALVSTVEWFTGETGGWISDDIDEGRLDNFYWLLTVLSAVNLLAFMVSATWYVYKESTMEKEEPPC